MFKWKGLIWGKSFLVFKSRKQVRICVTKMLYLYHIKHQYWNKIISKFINIFKHRKILSRPWISKDSALITSPGKFIHCWIILKQNIFLGFRLNISFFNVYYYLYQYSHKMWVTRFPFHLLLLQLFVNGAGREDRIVVTR